MTKRIGGGRRKTRYLFQKKRKHKGTLNLTKYFQIFNIEEKVVLKAEPAVQNAMYHRRFHGKTGIVTGKKGRCYNVEIKDGGKKKSLIVHPIHLQKIKVNKDHIKKVTK